MYHFQFQFPFSHSHLIHTTVNSNQRSIKSIIRLFNAVDYNLSYTHRYLARCWVSHIHTFHTRAHTHWNRDSMGIGNSAHLFMTFFRVCSLGTAHFVKSNLGDSRIHLQLVRLWVNCFLLLSPNACEIHKNVFQLNYTEQMNYSAKVNVLEQGLCYKLIHIHIHLWMQSKALCKPISRTNLHTIRTQHRQIGTYFIILIISRRRSYYTNEERNKRNLVMKSVNFHFVVLFALSLALFDSFLYSFSMLPFLTFSFISGSMWNNPCEWFGLRANDTNSMCLHSAQCKPGGKTERNGECVFFSSKRQRSTKSRSLLSFSGRESMKFAWRAKQARYW